MSSFKEMIQDIIAGFNEDNLNGITLYKGATEILEYPYDKDNIGDLGSGWYLTPYKQEAERYAIRKYNQLKLEYEEGISKEFENALKVVNVYFLSKEFLEIAESKYIETEPEAFIHYYQEVKTKFGSEEDLIASDFTLNRQDKVIEIMNKRNIPVGKRLKLLEKYVYKDYFTKQIVLRNAILDYLEFVEFYTLD